MYGHYGVSGLDSDWALLGIVALGGLVVFIILFLELRAWERFRQESIRMARAMGDDMDIKRFGKEAK